MNYNSAWYYIEIYGNWIDHLRNPIAKLVFDKKYRQDYVPGYYPAKSFGELNRQIGSIPDNPIQSLTDFNITIDSVYSSRDGSFSTVNLFYYLETVNEDFDIVGSNAVLFLTDGNEVETIFKCCVTECSTESLTTRISFSERIGAPNIEAKDLSIPIGNFNDASALYPVEITKDEAGTEEIILSKEPIKKFNGLYIYSEKTKEYIPAEFEIYKLSPDKTKILFSKDSLAKTTQTTAISDYFLETVANVNKLRPNSTETSPTNIYVGNSNKEPMEVWNNQIAYTLGGQSLVMLNRPAPSSKRREHAIGEDIELVEIGSKQFLIINLFSTPESITETGSEGASKDLYTYTSFDINDNPIEIFAPPDGLPDSIFEPRKEIDNPVVLGQPYYVTRALGSNYKYNYPYVSISPKKGIRVNFAFARFSVKFPTVDLPSSATLTGNMGINIRYECVNCYFCDAILNFGEDSYNHILYSSNNSSDIPKNREFNLQQNYPHNYVSFEKTQTAHINIILGRNLKNDGNTNNDNFILKYFRVQRKVKIPYNDVKLYASIVPVTKNASNQSQYAVPAVYSLLNAANIIGYNVIADGTISENKVNSIIIKENVKFRDKLKNLAIVTSTLVRFNSVSDSFIVSGNSSAQGKQIINIPLDCILSDNNMYKFSMKTPRKDEIYSGLQISYNKDVSTGKYKDKILVNSLGVQKSNNIKPSLYWDNIIFQLGKNSNSGIENIKTLETEWVRDSSSAEYMAYNYIQWICSPLKKASISVIKQLAPKIDIGSYVSFSLPGYPPKFSEITWIATAVTDNLDTYETIIDLMEVWNIKAPIPERYILTENKDYINTELTEQHLQME